MSALSHACVVVQVVYIYPSLIGKVIEGVYAYAVAAIVSPYHAVGLAEGYEMVAIEAVVVGRHSVEPPARLQPYVALLQTLALGEMPVRVVLDVAVALLLHYTQP